MKMEKNKFYSKPLMVLEEFTPQEFVAGCNKPISPSTIGVSFYADIFNGKRSSYGSGDGICDGSLENFYNSAPGGITNYATQGDGWYRGIALYTKKGSGGNNQDYTNTSFFNILSGYENVDLYISPNRGAYIWVNGAPANITYDNHGDPQPTFS